MSPVVENSTVFLGAGVGDDRDGSNNLWRDHVLSIKHADKPPLQMGETPAGLQKTAVPDGRVAQAIGGGGGGNEDDDLQARLDSLRR